jgi:hypothetical protein
MGPLGLPSEEKLSSVEDEVGLTTLLLFGMQLGLHITRQLGQESRIVSFAKSKMNLDGGEKKSLVSECLVK